MLICMTMRRHFSRISLSDSPFSGTKSNRLEQRIKLAFSLLFKRDFQTTKKPYRSALRQGILRQVSPAGGAYSFSFLNINRQHEKRQKFLLLIFV